MEEQHDHSHSDHMPVMMMGTLGGHLLPGVLFVIWGVCTVLVSWSRYHKSGFSGQPPYMTTCHPVPSGPSAGRRLARLFFFIAPVVGMLGEGRRNYRLWTHYKGHFRHFFS